MQLRVVFFISLIGWASVSVCGQSDCQPNHRPVVMVHGFLAAGDTWRSFYHYFRTAGYCPEHLYAHDWNTLNQGADHVRALDEAIDTLLARTGAHQVDLIGHSAGGGLAYRYLSDSTRASKVARYVHIGSARQQRAAGPDGRIPTLNLWSDGDRVAVGGDIEGAVNQMLSGLDHYQVATHRHAFQVVYRFLNDSLPLSAAQSIGERVNIGGRAVFFGDNTPAAHARIELYYLSSTTGERMHLQADKETQADAQGRWKFSDIRANTPVEMVLRSANNARPVHYFFDGFDHSDPLIYLRALPVERNMVSMLLAQLPAASEQALLCIYLSSQAAIAGRDSLTLNGLVLSSAAIAPAEKTAISFFLYDENNNGRTDGTPLTRFARLPFLTGADVFVSPGPPSPIEISFNGKRRLIRPMPSDQGVQVVVF